MAGEPCDTRFLMAGTYVDDQINAILYKYDLWEPDQYRQAVSELAAYLMTLTKKELEGSLYHTRIKEKIHLENCLMRSDEFQGSGD